MKDISVEQLANIIGTPVDKILLQMKEAGLGQSSPTDLVTDEDKKVLLGFLKSQQNKVSKTISLKRKATPETASKTTTIENNILTDGYIDLSRMFGTVTIQNNDIYNSHSESIRGIVADIMSVNSKGSKYHWI